MRQLLYYSYAVNLNDSDIDQILAKSVSNNTHDSITGCLLFNGFVMLQLLEGPAGVVEKTFARIEKDKRHSGVEVLDRRDTDRRLFPYWAMVAKKDTDFKDSELDKVKELFARIENPGSAEQIFSFLHSIKTELSDPSPVIRI